MLALFTAIGGQLWDNDQTRLAKAILSTNAVLFQSQPCDACFRCSMKFTSTYTIPVGQFDTGLIAFDGVRAKPIAAHNSNLWRPWSEIARQTS